MSNCQTNGNNKTIRQSSTDSKCFLNILNKNQTIIFNFICISLWLFIVITFFKQLLTIITYFLVFLQFKIIFIENNYEQL